MILKMILGDLRVKLSLAVKVPEGACHRSRLFLISR